MKLIKLSDIHYVVVDDSEIKEGDWYLTEIPQTIWRYDITKGLSSSRGQNKKITHSTLLYKGMESVTFMSLREVKELLGEEDVEKKANEYFTETNPYHPEYNEGLHIGYKVGYNQAIEDNKEKKWTDADVIRIVEKSRQTGLTAEYLMLSLYSQTEWEVEIVNNKLKLKS